MITKKSFIALGLALFTALSPLSVLANSLSLSAYGLDTVAGGSTIIKTSNALPDVKINFNIAKPDQSLLTIPVLSDQNGNAQVELYDYHTQKAGKYCVSAYYPGYQNSLLNENCFNVYAGEVNADKSSVSASKLVIYNDNNDVSSINVVLVDDYDNPVDGHSVKLISSSAEDQIFSQNDFTDKNGSVNFDIKSSKNGVSYITAIDNTENVVLTSRLSLAFENETEYLADAGGNLINIANAQDAGALAGFELTGFPTSIAPNQNVSFSVKAVDADKLTVEDYTGTVRFSAEGSNSSAANLPLDYKFEATDLGIHAFNLGISFTEAGTYKIIVNDTSDKYKKGEITVDVASESSSGLLSDTVPTANAPKIITPAAGTYNQAKQTITGTAKIGATLKIYDNDTQIGIVPVGSAGKFSFQTPLLTDGTHKLSAIMVDAITAKVLGNSNVVEIIVDTTAPKIDEISLDPKDGISAGDVIKVQIYSEPNLNQAVITFNNEIVELRANSTDNTLYEGEIMAPSKVGDYAIDVLLIDELGNEITYSKKATISVGADGKTTVSQEEPATTPVEEVTKPVETVVEGAPSQVKGLNAYGSDNRVTLVWDAATDNGKVDHYKIYFGEKLDQLTNMVETVDASPTWYIPNLDNGKEYFFSVTAIDDEGNESNDKSTVVSGIPFVIEINTIGKPDQQISDNTEDMLKPSAFDEMTKPSNQPKTGPEMILFFAGSLVAGLFIPKKRK
jgi:hypothetical protein